jgi:hypothetical protein
VLEIQPWNDLARFAFKQGRDFGFHRQHDAVGGVQVNPESSGRAERMANGNF